MKLLSSSFVCFIRICKVRYYSLRAVFAFYINLIIVLVSLTLSPPDFKPYKPTYDLKGEKAGSDKFECRVCNRFFNGDIPYRMHMSSKAHKEEVALAEEYARAK